MKIFKYMLFIVMLIFSIIFIIQLNELNIDNQTSILIKIPYLVKIEGFHDGMEVWAAIIMTLSIGVFIGFIIALFQMIAQKSEVISLKSKLRRLKNELDNLRNNAIDDDIEIIDEIEEDSEI